VPLWAGSEQPRLSPLGDLCLFSLIVFPYLHLLTDSYNCVCICVDMCRIQNIGGSMDHITDFAILMGQIAVITLVTIIWRYL
jgi:hypothetical protein